MIGVAEMPTGGFGFTGISDEQAKTWDPSRVGRKVNAYADPSVSSSVRIVECDGAKFVVIGVNGFEKTPHITKKEYVHPVWGRVIVGNTFYIRTEACETRPVGSAEQLNELLERAMQFRVGDSASSATLGRQHFGNQIRAELALLEDPYPDELFDAYFTDEMFPAIFETNRFTRQQLRDALNAAYQRHTPHAFMMYRDDYDQVRTMPDGFKLNLVTSNDHYAAYFYWRIFYSGAAIVRSLAWEDAYYSPQGVRRIFVDSIVAHVAEAIEALVNLYSALGVAGEEVTWRTELAGTNGRLVEDGNQLLPTYGRRSPTQESTISYTKTLMLEEWSSGMFDQIVAATRDILDQLNAVVISDEEIRKRATEYLNRRPRL